MRVQLIHAPIYENPRAVQATRPSLPLGLAYIAAAIRDGGHAVSVLDAVALGLDQTTRDGRLQYTGLGPEAIAEAIDSEAEVIGIGALFSFSWPLIRRIIHVLKQRHPDKVIVCGGEHFTEMPDHSLATAPIDYIVLGEGEQSLLALLDALESGAPDPAALPGLAFMRNGAAVNTGRRGRIRDVNALPWPAWDLFEPRAYYTHGYIMGVDAGMTMPILATRGCPYACTYCSNATMWQRRWYARDPANVVDEIEHYHREYGAVNFPFHDLTAILRRSWIAAFCEELLMRDLPITWQLPAGTRCEVVDREVTDLLRRTGCHSITFAPESGSARTRKLVGKKMTEENLMRAVRAAVRSGLNVSSFFVIGFPRDTAADLRQSLRLAFKLAVAGSNDIAMSCFFPIPGTQLYEELVASGRIEPSDEILLTPMFSMDAAIGEPNNYCEALSARSLTGFKYAILLTFYATSFLVRPWRAFHIAWNVLRGHETCRLDIFLNSQKKRLLKGIRTLWGRSPARPLDSGFRHEGE